MSTEYSAWVQVGFQFELEAFLDNFRVLPDKDKYAFDGRTFEDEDDNDDTPWEQLLDAICVKIGAERADYGTSGCELLMISPSLEEVLYEGTDTDVGRLSVGHRLDYKKVIALDQEIERIGKELAVLGVPCPPPTIDCCWAAG
jgi:hypothetical protein